TLCRLPIQDHRRQGEMSLSIYMKGDYEELHALRLRNNKAKQSQLAGLWPEIRSTKLKIRN
ncbi:hypothetical protein ACFL3Q_13470, partial [Planctomycetota bacterium]